MRSSRRWSRTCTGRTSTPLEEAAAYQQLIEDFGLTHEQVATRVGKSRVAITNTLRLLPAAAASSSCWPTGGSAPGTPRRCSARPTARSRSSWPAGRGRGLVGPRRRGGGPRPRRRRPAAEAGRAGRTRAATAPAPPRRLRPPGLLELEELLADHLDTRVAVDDGRAGARSWSSSPTSTTSSASTGMMRPDVRSERPGDGPTSTLRVEPAGFIAQLRAELRTSRGRCTVEAHAVDVRSGSTVVAARPSVDGARCDRRGQRAARGRRPCGRARGGTAPPASGSRAGSAAACR